MPDAPTPTGARDMRTTKQQDQTGQPRPLPTSPPPIPAGEAVVDGTVRPLQYGLPPWLTVRFVCPVCSKLVRRIWGDLHVEALGIGEVRPLMADCCGRLVLVRPADTDKNRVALRWFWRAMARW